MAITVGKMSQERSFISPLTLEYYGGLMKHCIAHFIVLWSTACGLEGHQDGIRRLSAGCQKCTTINQRALYMT